MRDEPQDEKAVNHSTNDGHMMSVGAHSTTSQRAQPLTPDPVRTSAGSKAKAKRKAAMSNIDNSGALGTPAGFAIAEEAQSLLTEANTNTQAMVDTINAIIRAETIEDIVRAALDNIRKAVWLGRMHPTGPLIQLETYWSFRSTPGKLIMSFND